MRAFDDMTLAAVGRMTVAAVDLEHLLASFADPAAFMTPGEGLRVALDAARSAPPAVREDLVAAVEGAGSQLATGQAVLRRLWSEGTADAALFDELAARLVSCRAWLHAAVAETAVRTG